MIRILKTSLTLLTLLIITGYAHSQEVDRYLDDLYKAGQLNGNVLVVKQGNIIYEKSFGYADASKQEKLTAGHRFNIGSIYKEFPAVAIMQLHEKGRLQLEDYISDYLPELPEWSQKVTIKHVLQYSSGLPTINWGYYFGNQIPPTEDMLFQELHRIDTLQFEPGSSYLYSNNNPLLLVRIVEHIEQIAFNEYLKKNIFTPTGMNETILSNQYPYLDRTLMAIPFNEHFEEDVFSLAVRSLLFSSTARDMAKWIQELGNFNIVKRESVKTLSETAQSNPDFQAPLGQVTWQYDNMIEHAHHGSSSNYECIIRRFKQEEITIVILTNQKHDNVREISERIKELVLD